MELLNSEVILENTDCRKIGGSERESANHDAIPDLSWKSLIYHDVKKAKNLENFAGHTKCFTFREFCLIKETDT